MKLQLTSSHLQAKLGGLDPSPHPEPQYMRKFISTADSLKFKLSDFPSGPFNRTWATGMAVPG